MSGESRNSIQTRVIEQFLEVSRLYLLKRNSVIRAFQLVKMPASVTTAHESHFYSVQGKGNGDYSVQRTSACCCESPIEIC